MPDMLNWFGWCTWDAFYTSVTAEGVRQGLERYMLFISFGYLWSCMLKHRRVNESIDSCSLEKGGIPPKFVIIDDGWQSVGMDPTGIEFKADNMAK